MNQPFLNTSALITGGAQGLGEAAARMLAKEGARVAITDVNIEGARKVAEQINAMRKGAAIAIKHDVTQPEQWVHALAETHKAFGGLHVLVNNAGISAGSDVEATSFEDWKRVHEIDLDSVFLGCKYAIPMMAETVKATGLGGSVSAEHAPRAAAATLVTPRHELPFLTLIKAGRSSRMGDRRLWVLFLPPVKAASWGLSSLSSTLQGLKGAVQGR